MILDVELTETFILKFKLTFDMALVPRNGIEKSWIETFFSSILCNGPIPKHVAFIMDGNRRFAAKKHVERIEGHRKGFDKLSEMLRWCHNLGIPEVTVYAFSAENFKRSQEEVDSLMELARNKFAKILEEVDQLLAHGIQILIVGELHMLPLDILDLAKRLMDATKTCSKCRLNVCVAYTSRLEMTQAVRDMTWGLENGLIDSSDINESLISKVLQIPEVDLLIRTSGEIRLSDFLLWQSSFSYLSFLKVLWPEFSMWDFYSAILQYQKAYSLLKQQTEDRNEPSSHKIHTFLNQLNFKRLEVYKTCTV